MCHGNDETAVVFEVHRLCRGAPVLEQFVLNAGGPLKTVLSLCVKFITFWVALKCVFADCVFGFTHSGVEHSMLPQVPREFWPEVSVNISQCNEKCHNVDLVQRVKVQT